MDELVIVMKEILQELEKMNTILDKISEECEFSIEDIYEDCKGLKG